MVDKIKVLFLAASPVDVAYRPNLDQEAAQIYERICASTERERFEFITRWAVRPDALQQILREVNPHIVHFSGHGSKTQGIILQDYAGNMAPVSKNALAGLFKILKGNIRVVVLNACHSRAQIQGLCQIIDYTVGMTKAVGDEAAIAFSAAFYQALAFGSTVTQAVELGKNQLELMAIPESKTPVLNVRDGVNPLEPLLTALPPVTAVPPVAATPAEAGSSVQTINMDGNSVLHGPVINRMNGTFNNKA
jgi:CHAT domain-containing protein